MTITIKLNDKKNSREFNRVIEINGLHVRYEYDEVDYKIKDYEITQSSNGNFEEKYRIENYVRHTSLRLF